MSIKGIAHPPSIRGTDSSNSSDSQNSSQSSSIENPIRHVVDLMKTVKTDTPEAELNSKSVSDGKGGRVEMNEEKPHYKPITAGLLNKKF